ncbi:class I SAM-dependent methyltransferase [Helicobacter sp.]|uniref:class I SAM-dependent methyltransferase n=1 Tax=Helicobacter sp. TaxID=218 RepID=UPI0025B87E4E|nr:class I SAM-dependent methyltransferase [Helicobacter sp.]MCI5968204.1 class I SAM-dependent methyltransferase [Helicobacter sp.]
MDKIIKIQKCRLCEGGDLVKVIELTKNPVGDRFWRDREKALKSELHNVEIMLCKECGQMQLSEVVEPAEIYTEEYLYTTGTSVGLIEHFRQSAKELIERFRIPQNALVLEIGSNEGAMLEAFREAGMRVLGVDPARIAVKKAQEKGIETIEGFFSLTLAQKIARERGKVKIVVANNVIANIPALVDIMQGIKEVLEDDGVFVFETSYAASVIQKHLIDTTYHEHISYFSVKPLGRFFTRCGLELFDAEEIWTKGGSLRGYVAKPLCFYKTKRLENLIKFEDSLIFASHIVANTTDFESLFGEISKALEENESFVFESFYAKAVLERNLLDMVYTEHLNYLSLLPLCVFLEKRGLSLYHAKEIASKGGSIQVWVSKNPNREKSKDLQELLEKEKEFFKQDVFARFSTNLLGFRERVREFALGVKKRQGKLVVYGASVGGIMMVYHLGLSDIIDCFVDDNPAKIGAYAPALGVLVYDSKVLEGEFNEVKEVISVAWRFMDSITKKHMQFLENGGKFYALELPTLEIKTYENTKESWMNVTILRGGGAFSS